MDRVGPPQLGQQLQTVQPQLHSLLHLFCALQTTLDPVVDSPSIEEFLSRLLRLHQGLQNEQQEPDVGELVLVGDFLELDSENLCDVETGELQDETHDVLVEFGVPSQSQHGGGEPSCLPHEPVVGEGQQRLVGQLVGYSAQ